MKKILEVLQNGEIDIRFLDEQSSFMARSFEESLKEMEKKGGKIMRFAPGVKPSFYKN